MVNEFRSAVANGCAEPSAAIHDRVHDDRVSGTSRLVRILASRVRAGLPRGSCVELSDLIQAGTVGLLQAARTFHPHCGVALATYAKFRIRGEMLDTVRRNGRHSPAGSTLESASDGEDMDLSGLLCALAEHSPFALLTSAQRAAVLRQEIGRLPPRHKQVVQMRYSGDYSLREIGAVLSVNESRVCQLHRSALDRLRRGLMRRGVRRLSHLM